jgi:hypothetical protein
LDLDRLLPRTIARRQFVIEAPCPRVWDLLAAVTYQELPVEQVDIVSLDSFRAVLRWQGAGIRVPFRLEGKLFDTSRPHSYGCIIKVRKGRVQVGVKVTMSLKESDQNRTEVFCTAVEEGRRTLAGIVLRGFQRNFALKMFDAIGARLQRLCSI